MADIELKSFPFDSMKVLNEESGQMEDDRLYEAQIFRNYFRKFLSNGVYFGTYKNYGENSMKVVLDTGLTIKVKKGCGIIEGVDYENESDRLITLDRPASGSRVDRIVVQMNSSLDTRMSKLIIKQGTGTTPAELTRTDNVYEICIAEVTVSSSSNLTDESIVDKRLDTTLCGIVNSLISVDGEELYEQFQEYVQSVEENMMLKNEDIVDDLASTDTDKALSAKQGCFLNINKMNKNDFYLISGRQLVREDQYFTTISFDYPEGFNKNNTILIGAMVSNPSSSSPNDYYERRIDVETDENNTYYYLRRFPEVCLRDLKIEVSFRGLSTAYYNYKLVLMKIS